MFYYKDLILVFLNFQNEKTIAYKNPLRLAHINSYAK